MTVEIALIISGISLALNVMVGIYTIWRGNKTDNKEDSSQLTTVIVKLENISDDTKEIKTDLRDVKSDLKDHSERLVKVEEAVKQVKHTLYGEKENSE